MEKSAPTMASLQKKCTEFEAFAREIENNKPTPAQAGVMDVPLFSAAMAHHVCSSYHRLTAKEGIPASPTHRRHVIEDLVDEAIAQEVQAHGLQWLDKKALREETLRIVEACHDRDEHD